MTARRVSALTEPAIAKAALERVIGGGGVVVFPADGTYGLACDPLDRAAVERIHALKGRDDGKPSAVLYFAPLVMRELLGGLGPASSAVVGALLPGPFTLVLANPEHRYPLACRATPDRLGVRLIGGPLAGARTPIFQTSANLSGMPSPDSVEGLDDALAAGVDLVIDGGRLPGAASTVIDIANVDADGEWSLLREGAVPAAEVERRIARVLRPDGSPRA
ncbi:threonylcarbamoyl-AMP synthase [Thermoleophilia bacterium SCSIO 60948]|nr:threonylcarbamoyl-AMP synthase [Thermoleophilia bacterium SCSIO 60948]